jgi:CBS domain-containing protein
MIPLIFGGQTIRGCSAEREVPVVSRKDPGRRLGSITMQDVVRAVARADEEETD